MIEAILQYKFLQYAIISAFLASIVSGLVGVIIVEKKLVMMTGGIAHTSYGGVGLSFLAGFQPIIGAFLFSIIAALGISFINNKLTGIKDVVIAMFWSLGMALGILFIGMTPGYPPNVTSYLFGSILSVTGFDLVLMSILTVIIIVLVVTFYQDWKAHLFDQEFTRVLRKKANLMEIVLLIVLAITVVVLIRVVGIILVIALLSVPAATASLLARKLHTRMIYSALLSFIAIISGLVISYFTDYSSGAVIVFVAILMYVSIWFIKVQNTKRLAGRLGGM